MPGGSGSKADSSELLKGSNPVPSLVVPSGKIVSVCISAIAPRTASICSATLVRSCRATNTVASFTYENGSKDSSLNFGGNVDWAGVGDAYFAMVAIPDKQTQGLEYRSSKYEVPIKPVKDGIISWVLRRDTTTETRHLITAIVPINADGSTTRIYTGTKDYFALKDYNKTLTQAIGRPIDIVDIVNFSNYRPIRPITKFLSVPILSSLNFLNNIFHNYGVSIIIFTFLFYSLLFPLRWSQSKSFKKASGNAPKMKDIQDRIKDLQKKACRPMTRECANCRWSN